MEQIQWRENTKIDSKGVESWARVYIQSYLKSVITQKVAHRCKTWKLGQDLSIIFNKSLSVSKSNLPRINKTYARHITNYFDRSLSNRKFVDLYISKTQMKLIIYFP